ncbi:hypothetical protein Agub_g10174 [Astrephomene gubernaculifera]|uniref:Lysosomal Pro-X carboxypeptidase n=1 Tax=Astrephomene gubernaculifera TaxID=47775 RepID=A0AAD3DUF8_9CHLO|nr:hypothetical protein Agub_g10174 [Astrephomene gubernaculifera]
MRGDRAACLAWALLMLALLAPSCLASRNRSRRRPTALHNDAVWSSGCLKESWYTQRLDHFRQHPGGKEQPTFQQRYFICDRYWSQSPGGARGPIFFYAGNEADVTLYVNATGLIWENAERFGALILFAEHRYYGETQPFGPDSWSVDPSYLSVEQALADYARLLWHLKRQLAAESSAVIAFGGSYGGMLAAWLRTKYPHLVAGAVAASAPVGAFPGVPGWEPSRFWQVVTYDATASAGAASDCASNVRLGFQSVLNLGRTAAGRAMLSRLLRLCGELPDEEAVLDVAYWLQGAFDAFAMGNYPYPSAYISDDPAHPLPAWPMRAACMHMSSILPAPNTTTSASSSASGFSSSSSSASPSSSTSSSSSETSTPATAASSAAASHAASNDTPQLASSKFVEALRDAAGVLYNVTGDVSCYEVQTSGPAAGNQGPWDYQWCTELMGQELPYYPATGVSDMFWNQGGFNWDALDEHCRQSWGVTPRADWSAFTYGGLNYRYASNIAFSNGLYDPWSSFGLLTNASDTVVAIIIPEGAHHLDLMYSHPADPPSVTAARLTEMQLVRSWIEQHDARRREDATTNQSSSRTDGGAAAAASAAGSTGKRGGLGSGGGKSRRSSSSSSSSSGVGGRAGLDTGIASSS